MIVVPVTAVIASITVPITRIAVAVTGVAIGRGVSVTISVSGVAVAIAVIRISAAKLAVILAGESPANRGCPVAVVVISSNGKGDRPVESLEVKAPGGRPEYRSDPYRGASNLAGRSECAN